MISRARWEAECLLMTRYFPEFSRFATRDGIIGFHGKLRRDHTGRIFTVRVQAKASQYPHLPPAVYIAPRPEPHHYELDGQLSIGMPGMPWHPARNSFVSRLLIASKYLAEFDRPEEDRNHDN
jgi:hypothetical protein